MMMTNALQTNEFLICFVASIASTVSYELLQVFELLQTGTKTIQVIRFDGSRSISKLEFRKKRVRCFFTDKR